MSARVLLYHDGQPCSSNLFTEISKDFAMPLHRQAPHFSHVQVRASRRSPRLLQHRRPFAGQRLHQVHLTLQPKSRFVAQSHTRISAPLHPHRYTNEEGASKCLQALHGRFFACVQLFPEFSPVIDFRNSRCRQVRWLVGRGGLLVLCACVAQATVCPCLSVWNACDMCASM